MDLNLLTACQYIQYFDFLRPQPAYYNLVYQHPSFRTENDDNDNYDYQ